MASLLFLLPGTSHRRGSPSFLTIAGSATDHSQEEPLAPLRDPESESEEEDEAGGRSDRRGG
jgi:hypothetical protein